MKTKHAILIFVVGLFITILGVGIRLQNQSVANVLLIIGTIFELIGAVLFLYKIFICPKNKNLSDE